eukprot:6026845-Pyramimonas_sp.AAC.1
MVSGRYSFALALIMMGWALPCARVSRFNLPTRIASSASSWGIWDMIIATPPESCCGTDPSTAPLIR